MLGGDTGLLVIGGPNTDSKLLGSGGGLFEPDVGFADEEVVEAEDCLFAAADSFCFKSFAGGATSGEADCGRRSRDGSREGSRERSTSGPFGRASLSLSLFRSFSLSLLSLGMEYAETVEGLVWLGATDGAEGGAEGDSSIEAGLGGFGRGGGNAVIGSVLLGSQVI